MTLKPNKPQYKCKPRRKKLGDNLHMGDTLPLLSDSTRRTPEDLFPDWKKMGATLREVTFAAEYLTNGFNSARAMLQIMPGSTPEVANANAPQMLRRPVVQQLLYEYTSAWLRGKCFELEYNLMETLQAMAFYDVSQFLDTDGNPKFSSWDEIPPALRRCIDGIEVRFFGAQATRQTVHFSFAKRMDALKAISNYVAIMKNGPLASSGNPSGAVSAEAELVLSAVLNSGRKVDRRSPAQRRADAAKEKSSVEKQESNAENTITFSGLG